MLLSLFRGGITTQSLIAFGIVVLVLLFSFPFHEVAHGYVAYRCGDPTARNLGRLTLNPLVHLNPIGTIMMLLFGFGYATPVPVNPRNFKHYKRDTALVAVAGPASNLLLALVFELLFRLSYLFVPEQITKGDGVFYIWFLFCQYSVLLNVGLAVFNLLPLPPLDGSRIVSVLLPGRIAYYYLKYERYIMIAVFLLLYIGVLNDLLDTLRAFLISGMDFLLDLTPLRLPFSFSFA